MLLFLHFFFALFLYFYSGDTSPEPALNKFDTQTEDDYRDQVNIPAENKITSRSDSSSRTKKLDIPSNRKSIRDEFCAKFREIPNDEDALRIEKCFSLYIKNQCVTEKRTSYKEWLKKNHSHEDCKSVNIQLSDRDLKVWRDKHNADENLIEDFFSGKK